MQSSRDQFHKLNLIRLDSNFSKLSKQTSTNNVLSNFPKLKKNVLLNHPHGRKI